MHLNRRSICLKAELDSLASAFEFVRGCAVEAAFSGDALGHLDLMVEEIFVNIALYAYPEGSPGQVEIVCACLPDGILEVEFSDQGVAYNPLLAPEPELSKSLSERRAGGLGIFIVRQWAEALDYQRDNTHNRLRFSVSNKSIAA